MKKLIALALALSLGGCANGFNPLSFTNPLTTSRIDVINASWGATLALGANYRDACSNRLIPPSCRPIVVRLQAAALPVQAAVRAANQASLNGTTNAIALVNAAGDAINDYKTLQMTYGVH